MTSILKRVALVLGVVMAAVLLRVRRVDSPVVKAPVVIAVKDMADGSTIDRIGVAVAWWPAGRIPAGAFTSVDSVVGRVARVSIVKGEALVPGRLALDRLWQDLDVKLTPGKRAMLIRINDPSGIAGLIQPNNRVDILVVIDGGGTKGRVAKLFLENMRVLAIGTALERTKEGRSIRAAVATVEVTPEEGKQLAIATTQGQIQLMLRGYRDPDSAKTNGVTTQQIVAGLNRATAVQTITIPQVPRRTPRR